ncbi:MAG TPA: DUF5666 domain-containing protein [Dehalococcoidia bacterium]|nr:DUF5666 domain-containing protein [Dehalococcoidia bacterium]
MRNLILFGALAGALALAAACGSSGKANNAPATQNTAQQPVAANAASAPALAATAAARTATPGPSVFATPATSAVERVNDTIASVSGSTITLQGGRSITVTPQTTITVRKAGSASSLQPGSVVAITAKQQPDNTLLASLVVIFPAAPGGASFLRQFPLDTGDLMTNATVQTVQGNSFTATFPGGSANVTLAPSAQVQVLSPGTLADLTPGTMISAAVANGVAQTISTQ